MPGTTPAPPTSDYRLAPAIGARIVGGLLVLLAIVLAVVTLLVTALGLPGSVLSLVAVVGLAAVLVAGYLLLRRVAVVHFGRDGYRIRLLRGAGVARAGWPDVREAATASPGGVPVVVLRLVDDRTTTIPVQVLAADREAFVRDLQAHLQHGHGLRPLSPP